MTLSHCGTEIGSSMMSISGTLVVCNVVVVAQQRGMFPSIITEFTVFKLRTSIRHVTFLKTVET